jgi:small subunit ribosomal protein S5
MIDSKDEIIEEEEIISEEQYEEETLEISRVSKTVKGGKRLKFRVLVVIGSESGLVGIGLGKSDQIPQAIQKAINSAKRDLIRVPLKARTIPYDVIGKCGSTRVFLAPAVSGTGIIAGGAVRKILDKAGVKDVIGKIYGSSNAVNVAKATINALKQLRDPVEIAKVRGVTLKQLFGL